MTVNLKKDIIDWLAHERYMGCIIYGKGNIGKTDYVKKFIKKNNDLNFIYLDVQKIFLEIDLNEFIFELNPEKFINWCIDEITKTETFPISAVIIDNFDFLINLWDDTKQRELVNKICKLEKSRFDKVVIVIMQEYSILQEANQQQDKTTSGRIIYFHDMEAI